MYQAPPVGAAIEARLSQIFLASPQHEGATGAGEPRADTKPGISYYISCLAHPAGDGQSGAFFQKGRNYILPSIRRGPAAWEHLMPAGLRRSASVKAVFWPEDLAGIQPPIILRLPAAPANKILAWAASPGSIHLPKNISPAFVGQYDYALSPPSARKLCCFPNWFFWFTSTRFSSWSRLILVPLSICYAKKRFKEISGGPGGRRTLPRRH